MLMLMERNARPRTFRARLVALASLGLALGGCVTPFHYAEIGAEGAGPYGYRDTQNADGSHTILVIMPAYSTDISRAQQFWDRRAAELCGDSNYEKTIFRAMRLTVHYDSYGGRPGDYYLEGYLRCRDDAAATPAAAEQ